jgi:lysozyme family protein
MPSLFPLAIPAVLQHEGGFVNDANDPGGATDFGVSLRWLKAQGLLTELEHSTATDDPITAVKKMTQEDASAFYQKFWWDAYGYGTVDAQNVANKILDMSVNLGAPRTHRMVQAAVGVKSDGVLGPTTYGEINHTQGTSLILTLKNTQASFYRNLVAKKPQMNEFLAGWLRRAAYAG